MTDWCKGAIRKFSLEFRQGSYKSSDYKIFSEEKQQGH